MNKMKKVCVSIVIIYVIMMILMADTVLSQDILYITPMIVGVIFVVYAGILVIRENKLIDDLENTRLNKKFNEYNTRLNRYFDDIKYAKKKTARLRHDFANHAQVLAELLTEEQYPQRDELLEAIKEELTEKVKVSYSDNTIVNLALELTIYELKEKGYNIQEDIDLFGLNNIEAYQLCYNIWLFVEVLTKLVKAKESVLLRLYVKDRSDKRIRIAYRAEAYTNYKKEVLLNRVYEFKMFKAVLDVTDGMLLTDIDHERIVVAGWMEVQKNV